MAVSRSRFTPFVKQCIVTGAVCCNIMGHGCVIGFPGVLLEQLHQPGSSITMSEEMESWIASVSAISMFVGNFLTPPVMARAGRKWAHYSVTLPVLVGWLITILATSAEALLVGRILHGISFGMMMPLRSVLIGEYTSPRNRGGFLTTIALAQAFGILFVHFIGSITSFQMTALISMFFSFISLLVTIYSPESPSWLAIKGKYDKCREVFIWLRGEEETPELEKMILASQHQSEKVNEKQDALKEMMKVAKRKEFYKPVILMFTMYIMLQYAGGTLMSVYATTVIRLLMGPKVNAPFWMVILDTQRLFFNIIAVFIINRVKRRTMMFATGILCAGSHLAMAGYVYAKNYNFLPFDSIWIPGVFINLQFISVAMGMVPLPSVIAGEVFPLRYRSLGSSISLISFAGTIFVVLKTFPGLISSVGLEGTYALYTGIIAACLFVTYVLLPETRGKTLQQIEEHFRGKPLVDHEASAKELEVLHGPGK